MNTTRTLKTLCSAAAVSLLTTTGAFASSDGSVSTNQVLISGPLILLFLGFCALVVVIQLIPAMITLYGMIKGALESKKQETVSAKTK
jgi:hypothetical protein